MFFSVIDSSVRRIFYPWFKWESIFYRSKLGKEFKTAIKTIRNFTMQVKIPLYYSIPRIY